MAYRDYGDRDRLWNRDLRERGRDRDWEEEDRYERERRYGQGYYGRTAGDENWDRWGNPRDYDRERGYRDYGWAGGPYGRPYGARYPEPSYSYGRFGTYGEPYYGLWRPGAYPGGYPVTTQGEARGRSFVGRGPKGWRRSDERIREDVSEALARNPDVDASNLELRVENGVVTLSGVVEDRGEKRLAEAISEDIFGVDDVNNELKIRHGFLAGITGEKADEREVTRSAARETTAGTATGTRGTSGTRTTGRTTRSGAG